MRYYQCKQYPIEFVLSENIDKRFDPHNHVRHYVISVVMQGVDARLLSMCVGTALIEETNLETAEGIVQELLREAMEQDIFVSKYYLIRKFKSSIGMTPHKFCIQNRIRKSQGMLDEEKSIGRIAAEMGFYDQSHFDKAFRRIVGISPSEYVHSKKQIAQGT